MTRRSRPRARTVAAATIAVFLAVFALLVFQLRSGRDPALGQGTTLAKAPPPPKRILVRKTIVTRVIVHLPAEEEDVAPVAAAAAPAVSYSAPAPAPLTTHSS
jgi:hypothetical protein